MAGALKLPPDFAAIPERVRQQYEAAINAAQTAASAPAVPPADPPATPEPVETPPAPQIPAEPIVTPPPVVEPPVVTPSTPAPATDQAAQIEALRQQYTEVVSTVAGLQASIAQYQADNARLHAELQEARSVPPSAMPENITQDSLRALGLTDDELDNGIDVYTGVAKLVNATVSSAVAKALAPLNATRWDTYVETRSKRIPDWETVNKSAEFNAYLAGTDPITKQRFSDLAQRANDAMDIDALAAIVEQFRAKHPAKPAATPQGNPVVTVPVAAQIKPEARTVPGPAAKPKISLAEYSRRMGDVARGKVNGRPATPQEVAAEHAELEAALKMGLT